MKKLMLVVAVLFIVGCTDAKLARVTSYGSSASIKCYSGGVVIYEGRSTGKVSSEQTSDGYFFMEEGSMRALEVSGDCIIDYKK